MKNTGFIFGKNIDDISMTLETMRLAMQRSKKGDEVVSGPTLWLIIAILGGLAVFGVYWAVMRNPQRVADAASKCLTQPMGPKFA